MAYYPRKYWDAAVPRWDETVTNKSFPHYFYYFEADLYIKDLIENSGVSLEVGAGTCGSTVNHASPERRIIAIDYSHRMLKAGLDKIRGAGLIRHVDLVVADECNLPFRDDCFDSVFSRGVALSYAADPERMAKEAYRVLRPRGELGLDFMNKNGQSKRKITRFDQIDGATYYVEMYNDDGKQKRIGYQLPENIRSPEGTMKGPFFVENESKPESLDLRSLPREEWWAVFYTPAQAKRLARESGFKDVKLYPLGSFTRGLQNPDFVMFLWENRDMLSKLQKDMATIFRLGSAVHIFMTAQKP